MKKNYWKIVFILLGIFGLSTLVYASGGHVENINFPRALDSYHDSGKGLLDTLSHRIEVEPFNLIATIIFICAIIHTFLTSKFMAIAHHWEHEHQKKIKEGKVDKKSVHLGAELFHFLGEVEAIFGIWSIILACAIIISHDWHTATYYISNKVNYTEPMFVVVIMTLAASRPILKFSELIMWRISNLFGGMLVAWWFTILTFGPLLGSFITEPAAMTIAALLLGEKFYDLEPSNKFKYATIGLLFVNISVGGTLSHFAAPPVLMVAIPWDWGFSFMVTNFGWKAVIGILISNVLYYYLFKKEMEELQKKYLIIRLKREIQAQYVKREILEDQFDNLHQEAESKLRVTNWIHSESNPLKDKLVEEVMGKFKDSPIDKERVIEAVEHRFDEVKKKELEKMVPGLLHPDERPMYHDPDWDNRDDWVPGWIMFIHVLFMVWTVVNAHYPVLFIGGFLFFLGFAQVTSPFQNRINLKPALLVGFFLAGLVIHGGLQGWWISPVLSSLSEVPLMLGATMLTAFNDNAAITYLSTLVPGFTDTMKYAVMSGAVTGGGLTVIANAPNPAGQSILKKYFENGVSPIGLLSGALIPTIIMGLCFMLLRF